FFWHAPFVLHPAYLIADPSPRPAQPHHLQPSSRPTLSHSRSDTPVMPKMPTTRCATHRHLLTCTYAVLAFLSAHPKLERLRSSGWLTRTKKSRISLIGRRTRTRRRNTPRPCSPDAVRHLHAPPALAVWLLERIARVPFAAPSSHTSSTLATSTRSTTGLQRDQQTSLDLFIVPFVPIRLEIVGVAGGGIDDDEIS
ncbi:hypothetical protein B0H19DRAFT_1303880, partial [Mycena capillaripes]